MQVVKLIETANIYIPADCLKVALACSQSGQQLARNLVKAIFVDKALTTCSVFGGISKGPLGKRAEARVPLHAEAINAIISLYA